MKPDPAEEIRKIVGEFLEECRILGRENSTIRERLAGLETKVLVMLWFLAVVGAGTVTSIIAWISKGGGK